MNHLRGFFCFLILCVGVQALGLRTANSTGHDPCALMLERARHLMDDEHILNLVEDDLELVAPNETLVEESTRLLAPQNEIDFLTELVMPVGYAENKADYLARKKKATDVLLPRLEKIQDEMGIFDASINFPERLARLARRYDEATEKTEKAALLGVSLRMFSIPVEHHYMNILTQSQFSNEFKLALYKGLKRIFIFDPSWLGPLERARQRGRF